VNDGDETSVVKTNLNIAMTRLKSTDFDEHIRKVDPKFFEREEEYEQKVNQRRDNRNARKYRQMRSEEIGAD